VAIVLYDAECGFCRWALARILAWDRQDRLRPVPIQGSEGGRLLADLPEERRLASWHLVTGDGRRYSAGAAIPPLMRMLPGGGPIATLASRFPRATEWLYQAVAARRGAFGRALRALTRVRSRLSARR
jgi:predicted DCC family thiol-disulfide oxidoreductase YuxK